MGLLGQLLGLDGGGLFGGQQQQDQDNGFNIGRLFSGLMSNPGNTSLPPGHIPGSTPPPAKGDGSLTYAQLARGQASAAARPQSYQTRHMRNGANSRIENGGSNRERVAAAARAAAEAEKTKKKG